MFKVPVLEPLRLLHVPHGLRREDVLPEVVIDVRVKVVAVEVKVVEQGVGRMEGTRFALRHGQPEQYRTKNPEAARRHRTPGLQMTGHAVLKAVFFLFLHSLNIVWL